MAERLKAAAVTVDWPSGGWQSLELRRVFKSPIPS